MANRRGRRSGISRHGAIITINRIAIITMNRIAIITIDIIAIITINGIASRKTRSPK